MRLDCSKISNKGDLLALFGLLVIATLLVIAVALAAYENSFVAGFFSATIIWKWHGWIYLPIDRMLNKLWPKSDAECGKRN